MKGTSMSCEIYFPFWSKGKHAVELCIFLQDVSGKFPLLPISLQNNWKEQCTHSVNQLHVLWTRKMLNTVEWIVLGNVYCGCTLMTGAYRLATAEASRTYKLLMRGRPGRFTINPQGNGKTQIPAKKLLVQSWFLVEIAQVVRTFQLYSWASSSNVGLREAQFPHNAKIKGRLTNQKCGLSDHSQKIRFHNWQKWCITYWLCLLIRVTDTVVLKLLVSRINRYSAFVRGFLSWVQLLAKHAVSVPLVLFFWRWKQSGVHGTLHGIKTRPTHPSPKKITPTIIKELQSWLLYRQYITFTNTKPSC